MEEGPPPPEFWESLFLRSSQYNVIFHAIIPTLFVTLSGQSPLSNDETINKAQQANLYCVSCQKKCKQGTKIRLCIRAVIGKSKGKNITTNETAHIYRSGFGSALLCCDKYTIPSLDSNTDMHEVLFEFLELTFPNLAFDNLYKKLSGEEILNIIGSKIHLNHDKLVHLVGKAENECKCCKKPKPPKRCAGCHYARYCNKACADTDWNRGHKKECKAIKSVKFIYPKNMIKIKSQ